MNTVIASSSAGFLKLSSSGPSSSATGGSSTSAATNGNSQVLSDANKSSDDQSQLSTQQSKTVNKSVNNKSPTPSTPKGKAGSCYRFDPYNDRMVFIKEDGTCSVKSQTMLSKFGEPEKDGFKLTALGFEILKFTDTYDGARAFFCFDFQ